MRHVDQIKDYIIRELVNDENEQIKEDALLIESGIIDSLGIMKLILYLEETYKVSIDADDILPENFSTIEKISAMLEKKLKGAHH